MPISGHSRRYEILKPTDGTGYRLRHPDVAVRPEDAPATEVAREVA